MQQSEENLFQVSNLTDILCKIFLNPVSISFLTAHLSVYLSLSVRLAVKGVQYQLYYTSYEVIKPESIRNKMNSVEVLTISGSKSTAL